ncbi:hypothetical protein OG384_15005 [Streptomyces sp. NBC_01324]|uniref:hypothetical protein n=1 Tax=Streptomyces sp. NBC_01324 TaxID=2903826 RepID=UPI002E115C51|nr:hypothetical protein OG384_15005 [Streptomyces sp. NBC_01324]
MSAVELAWFGCDMLTGAIIEDLPSLKPSGALSRKLGDQTTSQFTLDLGGAPAEWVVATDPGRTLLVAVDTLTDMPVWAGVVLPREAGSANTVSLGAATLERFLDSRFPGTRTYWGADQADVLAGLLTPALVNGPPLVIDSAATGVAMNYSVDDGDDKTILSCAQEVMALEGGPEWTIEAAWNAGHSGFVFPIRIRSKIGTQTDWPEGTFDFPGSVSAYTLTESYEAGKGATRVFARGEGEGSSRLTSTPHDATALLAAGWPLWEYRYTPATGVTDPDQLNAHAAESVALMAQGATVWSLEAVASQAPRLGRDWVLGDTIRFAVDRSPRHPTGVDVVARCWSWELEPAADKVRPILVEDS